jgi:dihydrofolate reductase
LIISLIAAVGKNRELGFKGKIPWYIPEDFKHFKQTTMGHHMIMGRKTFESIGKALPGRTTIVLSRNINNSTSQIPWVDDPNKALSFASENNEKECFIVGGGEIYNLFSNKADKIYLSTVDFEGEADAYFPDFDVEKYKITESKEYAETEKTPAWKFELFERK